MAHERPDRTARSVRFIPVLLASVFSLLLPAPPGSAAELTRAFVQVRLPLPAGAESGRVTGLTERGAAVGHFVDQDGTHKPFVFVDGVFIELSLDAIIGATGGRAVNAVDLDPNGIRIAGEAYTPDGRMAVYWDSVEASAIAIPVPGTNARVQRVGKEGRICGVAYQAADPFAYVFEPATGEVTILASGEPAIASDVSSLRFGGVVTVGSQLVGGTWQASLNHEGGLIRTAHPVLAERSAIERGFANWGQAAGWAQLHNGTQTPVFWSDFGARISAYDPFGGASAIACDMNAHTEIVISRTDGAPGAALWIQRAGRPFQRNLDDIVFFRRATSRMASANTINSQMWIGGSSTETDGHSERPCLLIPYDINNNRAPDLREIVDDPSLDTNENLTLDWGENMEGARIRCGFHSPGGANLSTLNLPNVQLVRIMLTPEYVRVLFDDPVEAEAFVDSINGYGRQPWPDGTPREILMYVRSAMPLDYAVRPPDGYVYKENYDYIIPEAPRISGEIARRAALTDLACLTAQIARNVDYVQIGNEVLGGNGLFYLGPDDLPEDPEWTGGVLNQVEAEHIEIACDRVFGWLEDIAWTVRESSALAGRPLRLVGPAVTRNFLYAASIEASPTTSLRSYLVYRMFEFARQNAEIAAVNLHYASTHELAEAEAGLDWVDSPTNWLIQYDVDPPGLAVTEWGPEASEEWSAGQDHEWLKYYVDWNGAPPSLPNWPDYLEQEWLSDPVLGPGPDYGSPRLLARMVSPGVTLACYAAYATTGSAAAPRTYDPSAIYCSSINPAYLSDPWLLNEDTLGAYIRSVDPFIIREGFDILHPFEQPPLVGCR